MSNVDYALIFDEVSLTVDAAECVLLLGFNGAGKTTLLRILATLLRPSGGALTVNDVDAVRYPEQIRSLIGMVAHGDLRVRGPDGAGTSGSGR